MPSIPRSHSSSSIPRSHSSQSIVSGGKSDHTSAFLSNFPFFQYLATQIPVSIIKAFYADYLFPQLSNPFLYTFDKRWLFSILEDQVIVYGQSLPHHQLSFLPIQRSTFDYNPKTLKCAYMQNHCIYLTKINQNSGEFCIQETNEMAYNVKHKKYVFGLSMARDNSDLWAVAKKKKIIVFRGKEVFVQVPRPGGLFDSSPIEDLAVSSKWLEWVSNGKIFLFDLQKKKLVLKAEMALLRGADLKVSCFIDETLGPICMTSNHDLFYCGNEGKHPRHRNMWEEYVRVTVERCDKAQEALINVTHTTQTLKIRVPHLPLSAARAVSSVVHLFDESLMAVELHGLSSQTAIEIARGLMLLSENNIQSLSLHGSTIGYKGFEAVAQFLTSPSCNVHTLSLTNSGLSHNSVEPVADALKHNQTITSLTLSCNDLLARGASFLSEAIKINRTIQHLDLYGCKLSEDGSSAILEAMAQNSTVKYLEVDRNILAVDGERSAARLLASQTSSLLSLNLSQTRCRCRDSLRSLAQNKRLRSLDLSYNIFDAESVKLLCAALLQNSTLQKLNLSHCRLSKDAARMILQNCSRAVTSLRFYDREVGDITDSRVRLDHDYT